jgi:hypothetical protein
MGIKLRHNNKFLCFGVTDYFFLRNYWTGFDKFHAQHSMLCGGFNFQSCGKSVLVRNLIDFMGNGTSNNFDKRYLQSVIKFMYEFSFFVFGWDVYKCEYELYYRSSKQVINQPTNKQTNKPTNKVIISTSQLVWNLKYHQKVKKFPALNGNFKVHYRLQNNSCLSLSRPW